MSLANCQPRMKFDPGKDFFLYLSNFAARLFLLNLPVASSAQESLMGNEKEFWHFLLLTGRVNS